MESSAPVSSSPSQEKPEKKFLFFGIGTGIGYGLLTSIVVFPLILIVLFVVAGIVDSYFYSFASYSFDEAIVPILGILSLLISLLFGGVAGFFSGRSAYRSANESGAVRNAGFGVLSCSVVGLIGLLVFPLLCVAFSVFLFLPLFSAAGESVGTIILVFVVPIIGIFIAYVVAVISGALTHRILARRSAVSKNDSMGE